MKFLEWFFRGMLIVGTCLMFSVSAAAYIDASMLTYALQIGTGVVIAVGAAIGILIVRLKKKMKDKLNIDTDAKKETEDKIVRRESPDAVDENTK